MEASQLSNPAAEHSPDDDWPQCAGCGRRRSTRCPACGEAGCDFPASRWPKRKPTQAAENAADPSTDSPAYRICPTCDEVFLPQFYRRCAWCGHDSGEGIELEELTLEPLGPVVWAVILGLLLGGLCSTAYFYYLFR